MENLILVDGHNMLFRIFFGMQRSMIHSDGRDLRCPVGFASSINKLVKDFESSKLLVVFDSITSTQKRLAFYPDYKQNRPDYSEMTDEDNPFTRLPEIYKALQVLDIAYLEAHDYEADDYIASVALAYQDKYNIIIVSTDSDFNQLVGDSIQIFKPRGKKSVLMTRDKVIETLGVSPEQVIEYKSLIGDTADNIPGIKGIGPKRAAEILSYGTIDQIISGATEIPDKYLMKVKDHYDILNRNKQLISMVLDVPFDLSETNIETHFDPLFKGKDVMALI